MTVAMTSEQMRAYDRHAILQCGVPGLVLMENAGRGAAERIAERMANATGPAVIVCGKGQNGGDGFVVARHLEARGLATDVFLLGKRSEVTGDAKTNLGALDGLGVEVTELEGDLGAFEEALERASLVVDALFGTGLTRPLEGLAAEVVSRVNLALRPVLALDVPSGIDATTGAALGVAVRAAATLTFAHPKTGLLQGDGVRHAGQVEVVPLGLPDAAVLDAVGFTAEAIDPADALLARGWRSPDTHKYRAGSVLVVAGSRGKTGAALLAASAALRAGAGLATIATWPEVAEGLDGRVLEVMTFPLDRASLGGSLERALERRGAVAIGPGLGLDEAAREVVERVVLGWKGPVVVDADALTLFAGRAEELRAAAGLRVLTPHAGELARLLGETATTVERDRFGSAARAAEQTGAVVVFKGPHTVVAHPDGTLRFLEGAEPLLATAGSGDVLAGLVAALAVHAQDLDALFDASCAAVLAHLVAARLWRDAARREGRAPDRGLLASDVANLLPHALASL
jgi:hydroxyethylthiazole kinase-like uncharacterized protein yjeF